MLPWVTALTQLLGLVTAVRAVMQARTPQGAVAWVRTMLEEDFTHTQRITTKDLHSRSLAFRFAVRAARLAAPVR